MPLHNHRRVNPLRERAALSVYVLSNRITKRMKQKLIEQKRKIDKSVIIVQDFKTPLLTMERTI